MTLGNSNGNNKGKKYLKIKGDEIITASNQIKYDHYSAWFNINYAKIKAKISMSSAYSSDVFNETFIHIGNKILYGGLDISDYQSYFSRAYFTNHILDSSKTINLVDINTLPYHFATTINKSSEVLEMVETIMKYVQCKFTQSQYTVFYTYFTQMGDKTTFRTLAKDLNVSTFTIHKTIRLILSDVRSNVNLKTLYDDIK